MTPGFCYGRTLARPMPPEDAAAFIDLRVVRSRDHGSVLVAVGLSEWPDRFDVDAVVHDLTPEEALDALRIASERLRVVNGMRPSTVVVVPAEQTERLREVAERIVDKCRLFGWWEKFMGVMKFFGTPADFAHKRETMVREVIAALARGDGTARVKLEGAA